MTQAQILHCLKTQQEALREQGVSTLSLFGSFATQQDATDSDVDLLISFDRPVGLFHVMSVKDSLERTLGRSVDLVTRDALHPHLKDKILKEAILVF